MLSVKCVHVLSSSQDNIQSVIIKEEGLEALADQASSDSGQYRDDRGQDDGDDPDYQVNFTNTSFSVCYLSITCTI